MADGGNQMNFSRTWSAAMPVFWHDIVFDPIKDPIQRRRRDFAAGRLCATEALAQAGLPTSSEVGRDSDLLPIWPQGWLGSISHCPLGATAMVAAASQCRALGIDMEPWLEGEVAQQISPHIASPTELALLAPLAMEQRLTLIYSAKESLYKALFPELRRFFDFDAARLVAANVDELALELAVDWGSNWRRGRQLTVAYRGSQDFVVTALTLPQEVGHVGF
jgi:enterobactin synthetase component D